MDILRVATLGLLKSTPLAVATEGLIGLDDGPGPEPEKKGGGGHRRREKITLMDMAMLAVGGGLVR
jgi:hypothetical protein